MALKVLLRKFKVKRFGTKAIEDKGAQKKRKAWVGISHGFHVVERNGNSERSVIAQREQIEGLEVWLFGVFDEFMGDGITKYLQSHLFDKNLSEDKIRRRAKETMKKAYLCSKSKMHEGEKTHGTQGSATMLVMNGEKFVAADFGGYKAVVYKDGMATQIGRKQQKKHQGHWSINGILNMRCVAGDGDQKSTKLVVGTQKVEPETEFVILASDGVWQVLRTQEAVDLIFHIEDAQKAAECLAEEALVRMSKSTISCIVVRFH